MIHPSTGPRRDGGSNANTRRIAIYGAGEAGRLLLDEILNNGRDRRVLGLFDDKLPAGTEIRPGVAVLGGKDSLERWVRALDLDEIYIAIPSLAPSKQAALSREIEQLGVGVQVLPTAGELLEGLPLKTQLGEDLLAALIGREVRDIDLPRISRFVAGKRILVTGAGGSIGAELVRQIARFGPAHLVLLDRYDTHLHGIQTWLADRGDTNFTPVLADVCETTGYRHVFAEQSLDLVIHAAAVKHVPLAESNIRETLRTNVIGTLRVLELACRHAVPRFLLISTDKAVRPTNVMGATKRACELLCQNLEAFPFRGGDTVISAVRFGNVLGSNGSVLPRFIHQIESGGPVTVTHPDIERFFMHCSEAAQLVLQAASLARGGEIFILDMGRPVRVADFARRLCRSYNLKVGRDVEIVMTGLRPGEKIKEELIIADAEERSCYESIYIISANGKRRADVDRLLAELRRHRALATERGALDWLQRAVPEFRPDAAQRTALAAARAPAGAGAA